MSFILDALKKSESDHQRQGGPALFEVKVAPPRGVLPPWAIAIAVLLAANLGVVLWLLLRHGTTATEVPPVAAAAPRTLPGTATTPIPLPAAPGATPSAGPSPTPAPAAVTSRSAAASQPAPAAPEPAANPDDYAPATEPPARGASHVQQGSDAGVPFYQQLAATPGNQLPQLRLDLHAYAEKSDDRWVMVNMHKLREGDSLPEGVRVEHITPDGAVLSWHGQQFLLTRE